MSDDLRGRAASHFRQLQDRICAELSRVDGSRFREDAWERPGGGGGITRVLENGTLFEKAGVNWSEVMGQVPPALAKELAGEGAEFVATGVSLVLHPRNPHVPAVHANYRFLSRGSGGWFGGGTNLTPSYPRTEDTVHFHRTLKEVCDRHDPGYHPRFKKWCDEYFFIPHRGEMRGVGGIFFDQVPATEEAFAFVRDAGDAFLPAYLPIAVRRMGTPWNEREREWQLLRRGRYAEFNLVYDRGTSFGLRTSGRIESILMSLPPLVRWGYDAQPAPGSIEARALEAFQPRDWLG